MDITELKNKAETEIAGAQNPSELEVVFRAYLGKKGELTQILRSLAELPEIDRRARGAEANELRDTLMKTLEKRSQELRVYTPKASPFIDVTVPGKKPSIGHLHPLTLVQKRVCEIFQSMGFEIAEGPEIEKEHYNFDALNIPEDHPARDMWDTFWLKPPASAKASAGKEKLLLRTHTSPVQIRYMEKHNPPLRIIAPGRIFRYEATDASHEINFYQLEGLMVGQEVTVANFKSVIEEFFQAFFGREVPIRLRPSYFPFTEPSFEIDMKFGKSGWMEIMGAGMVHPNVFKAVKYDSKKWHGFAFGIGLDRLCMLKYHIPDIRLLYSGDLHFLEQF